MSLEIDLVDLFGDEVSEDVAVSFGQAVIDTILDRTASGRSVQGRSFPSYSDDYADSLQFKAAGKSQGSPDLELTGGMLSSIDITNATPRSITIAITDPDEVPKAFNHHTGDTVPARPFFGLSGREIDSLRRDFAPEVEDAADRMESILGGLGTAAQTAEAVRRISLLDLLGELDDF